MTAPGTEPTPSPSPVPGPPPPVDELTAAKAKAGTGMMEQLKNEATHCLPARTQSALFAQMKTAKSPAEYEKAVSAFVSATARAIHDRFAEEKKKLERKRDKIFYRLKKRGVADPEKDMETEIYTARIKKIGESLDRLAATPYDYVASVFKDDFVKARADLHYNLTQSMDYYDKELKKLNKAEKTSTQAQQSFASRVFLAAVRLIPGAADAFADAETAVSIRRAALLQLKQDTQQFMGKLETAFKDEFTPIVPTVPTPPSPTKVSIPTLDELAKGKDAATDEMGPAIPATPEAGTPGIEPTAAPTPAPAPSAEPPTFTADETKTLNTLIGSNPLDHTLSSDMAQDVWNKATKLREFANSPAIAADPAKQKYVLNLAHGFQEAVIQPFQVGDTTTFPATAEEARARADYIETMAHSGHGTLATWPETVSALREKADVREKVEQAEDARMADYLKTLSHPGLGKDLTEERSTARTM